MTPREWVDALLAVVMFPHEQNREHLAEGLAELLAARGPAKVAPPIVAGTRFEHLAHGSMAGVWTVVTMGDGLNLDRGGEPWWNRSRTENEIRFFTECDGGGMRLWRRLPDEPDHAAEVARLTAELAALTAKHDAVIAINAAMGREKNVLECHARDKASHVDMLMRERDHAEARTAELEAAIRVLIGKVQA